MTLQPIPSEFPFIYEENLIFFLSVYLRSLPVLAVLCHEVEEVDQHVQRVPVHLDSE
jgi:hypothetical protein